MPIKRIIKEFLLTLVSNDACWTIIKLLGLSSIRLLDELRRYHLAQAEIARITSRIRDRIEEKGMNVLSGPFAGMHYPSFASRGSALVPKLLGTYEQELHSTIHLFLKQEFPIIVDVGCAEGYYAVGLARSCAKAKILAYDTDRTSRDLCQRMAASNGVDDRLSVFGSCTPESLLSLDFSRGGLVVSDCEGYEELLFTKETVKHLKNAHVIIELHDTCVIGITEKIVTLFSSSHHAEIIKSLPDETKATQYKSEVVGDSDMEERMVAFAEGRPVIMNWAVISPKINA